MMNDSFIHSFIYPRGPGGGVQLGPSPHGGPSCTPPKGKCLPQAPILSGLYSGATAMSLSLPCQSGVRVQSRKGSGPPGPLPSPATAVLLLFAADLAPPPRLAHSLHNSAPTRPLAELQASLPGGTA